MTRPSDSQQKKQQQTNKTKQNKNKKTPQTNKKTNTKQNKTIENGQNTEKSPGNLRKLAVTQTPVKVHRVKLKESEKRNEYLDLARKLKKKYNWYAWNNLQRLGKETGRLGNKKTSGDHSDYSIIKIGQNTEKSPGDLRRLVTQTPVKNHSPTMVRKTLKRVK